MKLNHEHKRDAGHSRTLRECMCRTCQLSRTVAALSQEVQDLKRAQSAAVAPSLPEPTKWAFGTGQPRSK